MIPKVPVLARRTFNSGFSSSHYNPRSLFTRVLSANSGDEFGFGDTFDYNATVVHERVHWLQHLGTSFGAFLEALRYSQIRTTLRWFNRIPNSTVDEMLASRKAGVKKILALDPQTSLPIFETGKDEYDLNLFREIWFGHQWLHSLFEDSRSVEKLCRPSGDLIGEVIGDVMLALCGDAGFDCSMKSEIVNDPIAARKWFSVEPPVAFVRMGDLRITSSVLMEAAATIAELILLPSGLWPAVVSESDFRDAASARINKIFNSSYGIPVKALLHELGMRGNMQQVIATANVLCFVALNPPLPPFVMQPPVDRAAWSWSDIYPPIRFATLCHAVKRLGLIGSCRDQNTLFAYINDITQLASVPTSLNYQFPETTPLCSVPDFDSKGFPEYSAAPHYEYLFWAQSKLASLRQDSLPMLASFGDCMSGELFKNHVDLIIAVDDGYAPFARCPLSWTSNDKVGYSCTVNLGNWLITSSALHNSFFDVVVGTGEFDLGFYPADVRNSGFASGLEDSISMNLMGG